MPASKTADYGRNIPKTHLKWETFVTPSIPVVTTDFAPGEHERPWPPISSPLVYGEQDAILVDSFITAEQARAQAYWIATKGKNLTTIYATHGHGDHFFGASVVLDRFPKARFVATPGAIEVMKAQVSPEYVAKFWESRFPNQLPKRLVIAEELKTDVLELEGESLFVIPLNFTDTAGTTCLHVPPLELIAAGDAAYNGVHPRLVESNQSRKNDEWRRGHQTLRLLTITRSIAMALPAIHPGEHLAEKLRALDMSATELAREIDVPTNRVTQILNGTRAITGDTALRPAHFFGTSAQFG